MENIIKFFLVCLLLPIGAIGQDVPAATWRAEPPLPAGTLNYSIRYSQTAELSQQTGNWQSMFLSGDMTYANADEHLPFSVDYGGGYGWSVGGPNYGNGLFQHLVISQGVAGHLWSATVMDGVSYTPQAPSLGFSGIAGTGEPITGQGSPSSLPTQTILTLNTKVLENTVSGLFSRQLSSALSLSVGASYDILHFPNGNGLDTNTDSANGGLTWRLGARDSVSSEYEFSYFTYPGLNFSLQTQSVMFGSTRSWTRQLSTNVSAGPEFISSSDPQIVPSSTILAVNANLGYQMRQGSIGLGYSRGISGGAGYMLGGEVDSASASYSRDVGKSTQVEFFGSYSRTATLQSQAAVLSPVPGLISGAVSGELAGAQVSRTLGRDLSVFANYSALWQGSNATVPGNTLNGLYQIFGFGIGFTPEPFRLRSAR